MVAGVPAQAVDGVAADLLVRVGVVEELEGALDAEQGPALEEGVQL